MKAEELLQIKKRLEALEQQKAIVEYERASILKSLKDEFGIDAEKMDVSLVLDDITKAVDNLEKEINTSVENLANELNKLEEEIKKCGMTF